MAEERDNELADKNGTSCAYCNLPVSTGQSSGKSRKEPASSTVYCCYGCRFAHSVVKEQGAEGAIRWTVIRLGLAIFFTMNLMAFTTDVAYAAQTAKPTKRSVEKSRRRQLSIAFSIRGRPSSRITGNANSMLNQRNTSKSFNWKGSGSTS